MSVQTATRATPINWQRRMQMRNGKVGHYLGQCALTGKRRVLTGNTRHEHIDDKDLYTTWLVDDFGVCRGDRKPSPHDVVGPAPEQAA